jgi:hypothetical protein
VGEHAQDGLDDVLHFFIWQPLLFPQHLLANEAFLDIGVIDGSSKLELWKFEGELLGKVNIEDELCSFVGTGGGALH